MVEFKIFNSINSGTWNLATELIQRVTARDKTALETKTTPLPKILK